MLFDFNKSTNDFQILDYLPLNAYYGYGYDGNMVIVIVIVIIVMVIVMVKI